MLQSSGIVAILGSGWLTWALTVLGRQGLRGLRSHSWTGQMKSSRFVSLISCDMGLSENRGPQNDDCSSFANKHMFPTGLEQYNSPIFRQTHMNHITHNCKNANSATYEVLFLRRRMTCNTRSASVLYIGTFVLRGCDWQDAGWISCFSLSLMSCWQMFDISKKPMIGNEHSSYESYVL